MTKAEIIANFDINGPAASDNIFGLPFDEEQAEVIILPVPWEVTVSYTAGTAGAPEAVKTASLQVDLYDPAIKDAWQMGIWMAPIDENLSQKSDEFRANAEAYLDAFVDG